MDALEVAIITIFIACICCTIYLIAIPLLHSYNIGNGVFKCLRYVINNPGSSTVVVVSSPHSIDLVWDSNSSRICMGLSCVQVPNYVQLVLYVSTPSASGSLSLENGTEYMFYIPAGVHVVRCISYWNYSAGRRVLWVIITLYK